MRTGRLTGGELGTRTGCFTSELGTTGHFTGEVLGLTFVLGRERRVVAGFFIRSSEWGLAAGGSGLE